MAGVGMEVVRKVMKTPENIRNVAVIGGTDSGILPLMDGLNRTASPSVSTEDGSRCKKYDVNPMTANLTCLYHKYTPADIPGVETLSAKKEFVINIMDTPGSVDFSAEVDTTLRMTDGAVILVDCISGVTLDTKLVLKQAIRERVKPLLFVNNIDRAITEYKLSQEDLYQTIHSVVEAAKGVVATYSDESGPMGSVQFSPLKGNVLFGSASQGWGVTLGEIAAKQAEKLKVTPSVLLGKLWGDNFYNPSQKKWKNEPSQDFTRAFNIFVLDPVFKLFGASGNAQGSALPDLIESLGATLTLDNNETNDRQKAQEMISQWLPISNSLLTMIVLHLPSPLTAQGYRTEVLLKRQTDAVGTSAIRTCDPKGPLIMFVSKWFQIGQTDIMYAVGRVFSGSIVSGSEIKEPQRNTKVTETSMVIGDNICPVPEVSCGNICAIRGVEQRIAKIGVVTSHSSPVVFNDIRPSVSPVIQLDLDPKNPADAPNLLTELKVLMKLYPILECSIAASGLHILTGTSEHLLMRCKTYLEKQIVLKPTKLHVAYRETITKEPDMLCTAVSPSNKKNETSIKTKPLPNGLCECIEEGFITADQDPIARADYLAKNFGFDANEAERFWSFGPGDNGLNLLYYSSKQVRDQGHVRDSLISGFRWATREGILCEEAMRGVRIEIRYAKWQLSEDSDAVEAIRRAIQGSVIAASPRLMEALSRVEVVCSQDATLAVREILTNRQGRLLEERRVGRTPMSIVSCYIPGEKCLGVTSELGSSAKSVQVAFDHWEIMNGDPLDPESPAAMVAMETRARKGLPSDIPGSHSSSA
ncbi:translation elongation factor 2-like [Ylistrum balloti]|uniref:translation elongation factor 2-like n=1 Tax=Ylistrum balloti TaxID=509963 RepID=UPI002905C478|nr:translation elongation factor 2-like [Ylistrum balloti]